jgi:hypothetical protein
MNQARTKSIIAGALLALIVTVSWGCEPYHDHDYRYDRYGRYERNDRDRDWRYDRYGRYDRDDWRDRDWDRDRDRDRDWDRDDRYGRRD